MSNENPTGPADYVTTDLCGSRVAGRIVEPGKKDQDLRLTPDEAEYALREGVIVAKGKTLSEGFGKASAKADDLRADIAAERARYAAVRTQGPGVTAPEAPAAGAAPPAEPTKTQPSGKAPAGTAGSAKVD